MRNNRRFRISAETKDSVLISAKHLRKALRAQGVKVKTETLTEGLNTLVNNIGQGKTEQQEATPVYNQAGDTLALAYQSFAGGDIETALHMAALAFTSEDCRPLMDAVVKCNDEAKPDDAEDALPVPDTDMDNDNNDNDNNNNDDAASPVVDTGNADVVAADQRYRDKLAKSIKRVTASIVANADDNNNDDLSAADDNNDNNNDNDNDNNNDAAEPTDDDEPLVGDNMPAATARVLKRLKKNRPDVIAAANKISLGGSKESRRMAQSFIRKIGNLSNK